MSPKMSERVAGMREKLPHRTGTVLLAIAAVVVGVFVVALVVTARPSFLGNYEGLEQEYATLETSAHSEVSCDGCHTDTLRDAIAHRAALVGDFYVGLFTDEENPRFVEIATPTNAACESCHFHDWSYDASRTAEIPHPAHLRVAIETRECVECHKWTAHDEEYIERHKEMPFSGVCASFGCHAGWKTTDECESCHHAVQEDEPQWIADHPETVAEVGPSPCLERCHTADECRQCHTTGERPDFPEVGADASLITIEREHVKDDWTEMHGSFAIDDDTKCYECHVARSECDACHAIRPEFHGSKDTWLNKHADFSEDAEAERRCLVCHEKDWCEECHDKFDEVS